MTNIEWMSLEEAWRSYNGRAKVQNMIKEWILSYSLDVNISHFYGANVAHFHLIMLAYNLMNLFKELVLRQKDNKRMGKQVTKRFVLKLPEDWLTMRSIMKGMVKFKIWLVLHNKGKGN